MLSWRQPRIFVSYRRDDSAVHARALYEDLVDAFGKDRVFFDVELIHFGDPFRKILDKQLAASTVVVAVIGPQWLTIAGEDGRPRISSDQDVVRHEIATTLRSGKRLIPVLVDGAKVPTAESLPADIAGLTELNFLQLADREIGRGNAELADAVRGARAGDLVTESQRRRRTRTVALGFTLALLFAAWISLFDLLSLDTRSASATLWLADVLAPQPVAGELQLVVIGPDTETALDKTFQGNPAARRDHARLIERLAEAGARTIAFDIFFTVPSDDDDAVLVEALEQARTKGTAVIFGAREIGRDGQPAMVPALRNAVSTWAMLCIGERLGYASAVPLVSRRVPGAAAAGAPSVDAPLTDGSGTDGSGTDASGADAGRAANNPAAPATTADPSAAGAPASSAPAPNTSAPSTPAPNATPRTQAFSLSLAAATPGRIRSATVVEGANKVVVFSEPDGATREYAYTEMQVISLPQTWCPVVQPGDTVATALFRMSPLATLQSDAHRLPYEKVLALDPDSLRKRFQGKTVLVGVQMPNADIFPVFRGWTNELRHGLELHADATSALLRGAVVEPLGWVGHFVAMIAATLIGSAARLWAPGGMAWPRRTLLVVTALAWMGLAVWLCVTQGTLVNITYVLVALAAGYWSAGRFGLR